METGRDRRDFLAAAIVILQGVIGGTVAVLLGGAVVGPSSLRRRETWLEPARSMRSTQVWGTTFFLNDGNRSVSTVDGSKLPGVTTDQRQDGRSRFDFEVVAEDLLRDTYWLRGGNMVRRFAHNYFEYKISDVKGNVPVTTMPVPEAVRTASLAPVVS